MKVGGRYEIISLLGKGGMGDVYLAKDDRLKMKWTIKRIPTTKKAGLHISNSFYSEVNVLRRIRHENLPHIVDIFREGNFTCLVMEYIEGRSLKEMLDNNEQLNRREITQIALELCNALNCLHSQNPPIIYRDMKPANIIRRPDGHVCLIDFGTSGIQRNVNTPVGTPKYAPEELFKGFSDIRSDIYSLGITLREISGENCDKDFKRILDRCTRSDPEERYRDVNELKRELLKYSHRIRRVLIPAMMTAVAFITCGSLIYGQNMKHRLLNLEYSVSEGRLDEYRMMLESGNEAYFAGDYETAESHYTSAVTMDKNRDEGYLALLKLYTNLGMQEEGLDRLELMIKNEAALSGELLYEMGLCAFYDLKDYSRSERYFAQTDIKKVPEAGYFQNISKVLCAVDIDGDYLSKSIEEFDSYNGNVSDLEERLRNDLNIASLLITYDDELNLIKGEDPLKRALTLCREAGKLAERIEMTDAYALKELDMLSTIYRLLGKKYTSSRREYYNRSIEYTKEFLEREEVVRDENEVRIKLLNMARMYGELKDPQSERKCYELYESEFGFEDATMIIGHIKCLLNEGGKEAETQRLFEKAEKIPDIGSNPDFVKLRERMKAKNNKNNIG
ncbi:MAG: serine/threonine protein kinase [Lachnospiraceae bacterium]|nr:serine/threonine protein kinase [Lachnospiraceae bacterium]